MFAERAEQLASVVESWPLGVHGSDTVAELIELIAAYFMGPGPVERRNDLRRQALHRRRIGRHPRRTKRGPTNLTPSSTPNLTTTGIAQPNYTTARDSILGRLSGNPNVVTVYHAGYTTADEPFLIMELADGGTLADLVSKPGQRLEWQEAISLILPVCAALGQAHHEQVLHRDIKPENILLSEGHPKLTDFGIAYLRDAAGATSTHITASWLHTAPETFDNRRDERSDLYSLASTLYNLISGQAPFYNPTDESLNPLIMRLASRTPPNLQPGIAPSAVDAFLQRGLAKDPATRPQTAEAFAQELHALLDHTQDVPVPVEEVAAPAQTVPQAHETVTARPRSVAKVHPQEVEDSLQVTTLAPRQGPQDTTGNRSRRPWWIAAAVAVAAAAVAGAFLVGGVGPDDLGAGESTSSTREAADRETTTSTDQTTTTTAVVTTTSTVALVEPVSDTELESRLDGLAEFGPVTSFELQHQYSQCVRIDGRHTGEARRVLNDAGTITVISFGSPADARSVLDDIHDAAGNSCEDINGDSRTIDRVIEQGGVLWILYRDDTADQLSVSYYYQSGDFVVAVFRSEDQGLGTAPAGPNYDNTVLNTALAVLPADS